MEFWSDHWRQGRESRGRESPPPPRSVQRQRTSGGSRGLRSLEAGVHGSFRTEFKPISKHLKSAKYFFNTVKWSRLWYAHALRMSIGRCILSCSAFLEMNHSITLSGDLLFATLNSRQGNATSSRYWNGISVHVIFSSSWHGLLHSVDLCKRTTLHK